jgi:hypothetical protein
MNQGKNLSGAVIVLILILSLTACRIDNEKMPTMNPDASTPPIASVEEISNPYRNFPALYCVTFSEREGVETLNIYKEQYYMPVERSFSVGYSGIHLAVNKIQIIGYELYIEYGEPSEGYVFAGGGPRVPRSNISFSDGFCTIAMEDTEVSQQLKIVENDVDPSISLVSIDQNAEDTVVKLKLNKSELCRYNFREDNNPITLMPYSIISFRSHDPYKYTDRW